MIATSNTDILFFILILCALQPLIDSGRRYNDERLVVEEDSRRAIFGSFYYDPLRDVFNIPPSENHPSQFNGSEVMSTGIGVNNPMSTLNTSVYDSTTIIEHMTPEGGPGSGPASHDHGEHLNHSDTYFRKRVTYNYNTPHRWGHFRYPLNLTRSHNQI
ncbi:hypothetical protein K1T71_000138 [Dendrolimus kikuchii]|uniref:Uncharacterized protein n=1 Tax=Dendrolimus kikuchii TaxID=765133 RepID=A0ACC1DIT9_9NEOP|nr:hypothetical protein K1T71_000138 [Dendrolimus kikuchii]